MGLKVYKSSAGSGKTFVLVREYITLCVLQPDSFRNILAITFTNKAAQEMKERIITALSQISHKKNNASSAYVEYMLPDIIEKTGKNETEVIKNAQKSLDQILHHYGEFAVGTIDSFMNRVIRSFSFDLNIPMDYEVEMDTDSMLQKVVSILISRVGKQKELTEFLVEYVKSRLEEDKNWNIEGSLFENSKILLQDQHLEYLDELSNLSLKDFKTFINEMLSYKRSFEKLIQDTAGKAYNLINSKGLEHGAFYRGSSGIKKYFEKLASFTKPDFYGNSYVATTMNEDKWFSGRATEEDKQSITEIKAELVSCYNQIVEISDAKLELFKIYNEIGKNIYPLAILNEMDQILSDYKQENGLLSISEFNKRIADVVLDEPVPFIYERLGEKYTGFLIDEFQDTSFLQWNNILPLLENSLSVDGYNLLVGDGKQAIYRWRGGDVELFTKLPVIKHADSNPIIKQREETIKRNFVEKKLTKNYRSKSEIVNFNNKFFIYSAGILQDYHKEIYKNCIQEIESENKGGYVEINLFDNENSELDFIEYNFLQVEKGIVASRKDNYNYADMAVLCRSNDKASKMANYLLSKDIPVVSSESLLLSSSTDVLFLINLTRLLIDERNLVAVSGVVFWLKQNKGIELDLLKIISGREDGKQFNVNLLQRLSELGYKVDSKFLIQLSVYDILEELVRIFGLNKQSNAFVQFLLDHVLDFQNDPLADLHYFIDWWETAGCQKSVVTPEDVDAVRIMTIHKAKGLEFPVVFYPFADQTINLARETLWIEIPENKTKTPKHAMVKAVKAITETPYANQYEEEERRSILDLLNLVYVVLTRATDRLYIYSKKAMSSNTLNVSSWLFGFLQHENIWVEDELVYRIGIADKKTTPAKLTRVETMDCFEACNWRDRLSVKTESDMEISKPEIKESIDFGNLIHLALSKVKTVKDLPRALLLFKQNLDDKEFDLLEKQLKTLMEDENIKPFFISKGQVFTEKEIYAGNGLVLRPDRIVVENNEAWVIDFKTGQPLEKHKAQIEKYKLHLSDLVNHKVYGVLLYIHEDGSSALVNI